jgi:long-chain acyl-CoA synthetase
MHPGIWAAKEPERAAIVMGRGETVTYRELDERVSRLEQLLESYGLEPGAVVALFSENSSRYHEVTWACRRAGYYFVAVNSHLTVEEVTYIVHDSGAEVLIVGASLAAIAAELTAAVLPAIGHRLSIGGAVSGYDDYDQAVSAFSPREVTWTGFQGELLQYSSGTTGRPKGIKRPLRPKPESFDEDMTVQFLRAIGFSECGMYLSPAPLYHTAPLMWTMGVHAMGGTTVVMEKFDPEETLRLIQGHGITHGQFVPTMFVRMLKLPREIRESYDVSSLQTVVHAAAPCPVEVKRAMIAWWGPIISEYWGSSEGAGATFITAPEWLEHPGSVGRGFVGTLPVCDENGKELPRGESGQIWAEGAVEFTYLNDEGKTAEAHNAAGWTSVGDVGRMDDDGYLFLTDRKAFMIISGGVNIYPQEAENLLIGHPKVLDVAVIGIPHEDFGEEVRAVVQPVRWEDAGPELGAELVAYCQANLASYKCPRQVDFDRELPRLDTGKLYKKTLQKRYQDAFEAARAAH